MTSDVSTTSLVITLLTLLTTTLTTAILTRRSERLRLQRQRNEPGHNPVNRQAIPVEQCISEIAAFIKMLSFHITQFQQHVQVQAAAQWHQRQLERFRRHQQQPEATVLNIGNRVYNDFFTGRDQNRNAFFPAFDGGIHDLWGNGNGNGAGYLGNYNHNNGFNGSYPSPYGVRSENMEREWNGLGPRPYRTILREYETVYRYGEEGNDGAEDEEHDIGHDDEQDYEPGEGPGDGNGYGSYHMSGYGSDDEPDDRYDGPDDEQNVEHRDGSHDENEADGNHPGPQPNGVTNTQESPKPPSNYRPPYSEDGDNECSPAEGAAPNIPPPQSTSNQTSVHMGFNEFAIATTDPEFHPRRRSIIVPYRGKGYEADANARASQSSPNENVVSQGSNEDASILNRPGFGELGRCITGFMGGGGSEKEYPERASGRSNSPMDPQVDDSLQKRELVHDTPGLVQPDFPITESPQQSRESDPQSQSRHPSRRSDERTDAPSSTPQGEHRSADNVDGRRLPGPSSHTIHTSGGPSDVQQLQKDAEVPKADCSSNICPTCHHYETTAESSRTKSATPLKLRPTDTVYPYFGNSGKGKEKEGNSIRRRRIHGIDRQEIFDDTHHIFEDDAVVINTPNTSDNLARSSRIDASIQEAREILQRSNDPTSRKLADYLLYLFEDLTKIRHSGEDLETTELTRSLRETLVESIHMASSCETPESRRANEILRRVLRHLPRSAENSFVNVSTRRLSEEEIDLQPGPSFRPPVAPFGYPSGPNAMMPSGFSTIRPIQTLEAPQLRYWRLRGPKVALQFNKHPSRCPNL